MKSFLRLRLIRLYPVYLSVTVLLLFLKGITLGSSRVEIRFGLLVILAALIIAYILSVRRIEATLQDCGNFISSGPIGAGPIAVTVSLLVAAAALMILHLGALFGRQPHVDGDPRSVGHGPGLAIGAAAGLDHQRGVVPQCPLVYLPIYVSGRLATGAEIAQLRAHTFMRLCPDCRLADNIGDPGVGRNPPCRPWLLRFLVRERVFVLYANGSGFVRAAQRHLDVTALVFLALAVVIPRLGSETAQCWINYLLVMGTPFLLAGATAESSSLANFLCTSPMMWLGRISYTLFLTHESSILILKLALPFGDYAGAPLLFSLLVTFTYLGFILVVALAFYRWVELPCAAALKSLSLKRKRAYAPVPYFERHAEVSFFGAS